MTNTIEEMRGFIEDVIYECGEINNCEENNIEIKLHRETIDDYFDNKQEDEDIRVERFMDKLIDCLREEFGGDYDYELINGVDYLANIIAI